MLIEFYAITFSVCWISVLCSKSNKRLIMRELASIKSDGWLMVNVKWDINRKCDTIVIWQQYQWLPGSYSLMNTNIISAAHNGAHPCLIPFSLCHRWADAGTRELFHLFLAIWQLGLWQTYKAFVLAQFSVGAKMQNG